MKIETRNAKIAFLFANCLDILKAKGHDYNPNGAAFKNIETIAIELGITPDMVLWVFLRKHLLSIETYLKTGKLKSSEELQGRFQDAINYLAMMSVYVSGQKADTTPVNLHVDGFVHTEAPVAFVVEKKETGINSLRPTHKPLSETEEGEKITDNSFGVTKLADNQDKEGLANPDGPMCGTPSKSNQAEKRGK